MPADNTPPERVEAVVFDHDGTLVDSITPDYEACSQVFREYGAELPAAVWAADVCGNTDGYPALFARLAESIGRHDAAARMRERLSELWAASLLPGSVPLMPAVRDVLDGLRESGVRLAVASAAPRTWVTGCLEHHRLLDRFQAVVAAEDVERRKPAPDAYLAAAARLGVPPERCVAVEDSLTGVDAALAAGMRVIAVPTPVTRSLDYSRADHVLPGLGGLTAALRAPSDRKAAHVRH
ncbi:HAD family hydrolase [Streptantibioticus parmotrematis]|uniref:HAD family hydrolase n=1 Tax=Streptantibioticus parmotrematis TaxID=2873249 RepID=UPI0027E14EFC|nr:HAD-IA family hydrolase [Streptantibioticus parmotrematis]